MPNQRKKRRYYRTGTYSRKVSEQDFDLITLPMRIINTPAQMLANILKHSPKREKRIRKAEDKLTSFSERRQRRFNQRYEKYPRRNKRW